MGVVSMPRPWQTWFASVEVLLARVHTETHAGTQAHTKRETETYRETEAPSDKVSQIEREAGMQTCCMRVLNIYCIF